MRFSLRLNNDLKLDEYIELAQSAEKANFDQLWISNDLFLRSAAVILPAVAMATSRLQIGCGIFNPYTINPSELAMFCATMDELSGNRFNLGLAAGAKDFLEWVGLDQRKPLAMMRESIAAIRGLLAGDVVELKGDMLQWGPEAYLRFDAPRVTPIYVGAMGPKMLQLSGEMADGVLPLLFPPEHYFNVKPLLEQGIERRDPSLNALDLAACIWVSLDDDPAAARRVLAQKVAYYGMALSPLILDQLGLTVSDFDDIVQALTIDKDEDKAIDLVDDRMLRIGVVGQPKDVIERLEPIVDTGATHLSFGPPLGPNPLEAVELLGQVVNHFK